MGVRRTALEFEGHFTQVPNEWVRDARLSRRARGLLVEIMSHRVGWHVTVAGLQKAGVEGRDAIKSALAELKEYGYLRVGQSRGEGGRFNEVEYELQDPATGDGFSVTGGSAASGPPADGSAASGESTTKNTISSEDHLSGDHGLFSGDELVEPPAPVPTFAEFYLAYPRKVAKEDARAAFDKAVKRASAVEIVEAARRFAADPNLPPKQFIPHPATWLNRGSWEDEALPPRVETSGGGSAPAPLSSELEGPDSWMAFNR
ncbi:MAG: hypothetical protein K0R60_59 [Microbacterium sp.]|jgi:hypothetical protein|nr:hypothetical protein [Microbacterium sp.]